MCKINWIKTFDRDEWDFLLSGLQKFGYGQKLIHVIKVVFTNIQSKIKINGFLSDHFTLIQRVRQGCPLSLLLHIIAAELLAKFIDND